MTTIPANLGASPAPIPIDFAQVSAQEEGGDFATMLQSNLIAITQSVSEPPQLEQSDGFVEGEQVTEELPARPLQDGLLPLANLDVVNEVKAEVLPSDGLPKSALPTTASSLVPEKIAADVATPTRIMAQHGMRFAPQPVDQSAAGEPNNNADSSAIDTSSTQFGPANGLGRSDAPVEVPEENSARQHAESANRYQALAADSNTRDSNSGDPLAAGDRPEPPAISSANDIAPPTALETPSFLPNHAVPATDSTTAVGGTNSVVPIESVSNQVAEHVLNARQSIENGKVRLEVQLDPPELGQITIELTEIDDQLSARLVVAKSSTVDAIRSSLPDMLDALNDAGVALDEFELSNSGREQQQTNDGGDGNPIYSNQESDDVRASSTRATQDPSRRLDILA